jgi:hypothetical protein
MDKKSDQGWAAHEQKLTGIAPQNPLLHPLSAVPGEDMSRPCFSAVLFLTLSLQAAGCGAALAAAIQNPDMVVLPDPDLSKAARFPAGAEEENSYAQGQDHADVSDPRWLAQRNCHGSRQWFLGPGTAS